MKDLSKYSEIIIWGAAFPPAELNSVATSSGYASEALLSLLERNGYKDKIIFFVDSNEKLHGKYRLGLEVKKPEEILKHPSALVIINSISMQAIQKSMTQMGIHNDYLIIPYYYYHGSIGGGYNKKIGRECALKYRNEIEKLFDTTDSQTRRYLEIIFEERLKGEDDLYTPEYYTGTGDKLNYFCDEELAPKGDVTYIDAGAYIGDSIEPVRLKYKDRLKKCIAFEPDSKSMLGLKKYIKDKGIENKCVIFPYALGSENKEIYFTQAGMASHECDFSEIKLDVKVFDELSDFEIISDAMVKMDIEGAELEALKGMEHFLKKYQPYLAICIYHKENDLYEIPKYIKSINPDYKLVIRGGWHLECWAVPKRHYIK